jgi:hypothetical protein
MTWCGEDLHAVMIKTVADNRGQPESAARLGGNADQPLTGEATARDYAPPTGD